MEMPPPREGGGGREGGGSEGKLRKNCQGVLLLTWVVRSHYNKESEKELSTTFFSRKRKKSRRIILKYNARIKGIIVNILLGLYGRS